jgi:hypothetical protein
MTEIAAITYSVLAVIVILFQLALAAGAPWGKLTMGGFHPGVLPTKLRIAALLQALLIAATVLIVLIEASLILSNLQSISRVGIWFVVAIYTASSLLNLITTSKWERRTGGPIALGMLASSLLVALH